MADPVSWLMIAKGWEVVDAGGEHVGKVDEVLGDKEADIWDGLTVSGEYVAAERVASIVDGQAVPDVGLALAEHLVDLADSLAALVDDLPAGLDQQPGDGVGHQTVCPSRIQTGP